MIPKPIPLTTILLSTLLPLLLPKLGAPGVKSETGPHKRGQGGTEQSSRLFQVHSENVEYARELTRQARPSGKARSPHPPSRMLKAGLEPSLSSATPWAQAVSTRPYSLKAASLKRLRFRKLWVGWTFHARGGGEELPAPQVQCVGRLRVTVLSTTSSKSLRLEGRAGGVGGMLLTKQN